MRGWWRGVAGMIVGVAWGLAAGACAPKPKLVNLPIVGQLGVGVVQGRSSFDHSAFDALLKAHARPDIGRVDYAGLKRDEARLDAYLKALEGADVRVLGGDEQLALLINAYNAYTLKIIVERYPDVRSIRDLKDPWTTARHNVGGQVMSLDQIEHGLLRPFYRDPRIHFAVNCASVGCPPLGDEAFTGERLNAQLDAATRRALRHPRYAKVEGGKLHLTQILKWYGDDFTSAEFKDHAPTVAAYVARYADAPVAALVRQADGDPEVVFMPYDWSLNDAR